VKKVGLNTHKNNSDISTLDGMQVKIWGAGSNSPPKLRSLKVLGNLEKSKKVWRCKKKLYGLI